MKGSIKVLLNEERCKGCELCVSVCPQGVLRMAERINKRGYHPVEIVDGSRCTGCLSCARMCPDVAIEIYKK